MALTTTVRFDYPQEYQSGDYPKGNGRIGPKRWRVNITGIGTATEDETNIRKIVLSDLITVDGQTPSKFKINKVTYDVTGFTGIYLSFDRSPDEKFIVISGANSGEKDWSKIGGRIDSGSGGTGDILLSTVGGSQYDTYDITIEFEVK